ncbi:MAG: 2-C-methyl-D-erythritol 4-phosphate cytidylyltransferase [Bacteroidales bacterium]|nr:2-C-methyl-D-erythritol 4-phosphate cytidylyltransferase [Bacteroidales bacterium]
MKNNKVIIVGGGTGSRMGTDIPKQFLLLRGKPVIMHTIERFRNFSSSLEITVVLPKNQFEYWHELCKQHKFNIPHKLVEGGITRFASVKNGINSISEAGLVAIHDAVRPLVSIDTIKNCFKEAEEKGNCIPVLEIKESIRKVDSEGKTKSVERKDYYTVQTPQVFEYSILKRAYEQPYQASFTDDSSVVENIGIKINISMGNSGNIKITIKEDLQIAEVLLK